MKMHAASQELYWTVCCLKDLVLFWLSAGGHCVKLAVSVETEFTFIAGDACICDATSLQYSNSLSVFILHGTIAFLFL